MSIMSRQDRYNYLCSIKRAMGTDKAMPHWPKSLTQEEEQFIQDFAMEKLNELLADPEIMAVFRRLKDR